MTNLPPQLAKLCRAVRSSYTGQSTSSSDIRCMPRWCCRGIHKVRALQVKRLIPLVASASPVTMTRKLRILALHSFRTSGKTFALQMNRAGLDEALQDLVEIVYVDAPNTASGPIPDDVKPYFDGPYFEWWNAEKDEERDRVTYTGWDKTKTFLEDVMQQQGPFDGIMGFSQGGACASTVAALQKLGTMAQEAPKLRFAIFWAGALIRDRNLSYIYKENMALPSVHIIGDKDYVKEWSEFQLTKWEHPVLIRHPRGHVIPRLEGEKLQLMRAFLQGRQQELEDGKSKL